MHYSFNLYINNILLILLWGILINKVSYTEELALSLIYLGLFIIISENVKESIKEMIINQTFTLIYYYEQLIYLKIKIIIKSLNILKNIKETKMYKNLNNIINYKLKTIKKKGANNRKKNNNMLKLNNILCFLIFKTYK